MIDFLHILLPILCASVGNVLIHLLGIKYKNYNVYLFSFIVNIVGAIFLLIFNLGFKIFTNDTFIFAAIYGCFLIAFTLSKTKALTTGPVAITTIIGCSNFVPVTIFNAIYWGDKISVFEIIGMVLMLACIILINLKSKKEGQEKVKINWKWIVYTSIYFIFSAFIAIFFRFQQHSDAANTNEMMMLASFIAAIAYGIFFLILYLVKRKNPNKTTVDKKQIQLFIIVSISFGLLNIILNRINFYNSATIDPALLFPVFNGSIVIITFFAGWFIFKEKVNKIQIIGVILGLIAILFSSEFFGLLTI